MKTNERCPVCNWRATSDSVNCLECGYSPPDLPSPVVDDGPCIDCGNSEQIGQGLLKEGIFEQFIDAILAPISERIIGRLIAGEDLRLLIRAEIQSVIIDMQKSPEEITREIAEAKLAAIPSGRDIPDWPANINDENPPHIRVPGGEELAT